MFNLIEYDMQWNISNV